MENVSEVSKNAINRIVETTDFGLGCPQTPLFLDEMVLRKQDICLFKFDITTSPIFSYRAVKTESKLAEFTKCLEYPQHELGYPIIRYFDLSASEVVNDWVMGENLCFFDRPKEQQPVVEMDDLRAIMEAVIRVHRHTSSNFSNVEFTPRTHALGLNEQELLPASRFHQRLIESFEPVQLYIDSASGKKNIKSDKVQELEKMIAKVSIFLEKCKPTIDTISHFSLLHGDLHAENMIRTPDGVKLIDFEYLHFGDRAMEFAYFLEHGSQAGYIKPENIDAVVEYYLTQLPKGEKPIKDPTFQDRLKVYQIYLTTKLTGLLAGGYTSQDPEAINRPLFEDVFQRAIELTESID